MRYRTFKGTAKEIAEQFKKDLYEARTHLVQLDPFQEACIWISKGLYRIIACYYGADVCLKSNGVATIQGIKVDKLLDDFNNGRLFFEVFGRKDGKLCPTKNGGYLYEEKRNGT